MPEYWQDLATARQREIEKLMVKTTRLDKLEELLDELAWGNAATASRDYGRGVAYAIGKVREAIA